MGGAGETAGGYAASEAGAGEEHKHQPTKVCVALYCSLVGFSNQGETVGGYAASEAGAREEYQYQPTKVCMALYCIFFFSHQ